MCLLVPFFAFSQSKPIKPKTQTTTTSGSSAKPPKKKTNTVSSKPTKQNAQTTRPTTSGTTKPISPQKDTGSTSPTTQQANTGSSSTSNNSVVSSSAARSKTYSVNGVTFEMVTVEGGSFRMGADDSEAWDDEKPVHSETVSTFRIGKTEVTQALWTAVMGSNPSNFKGDNLPVEKVSWNDCKTFISKLNSLTGENFRLPTESEWEYAARGGNKSRGYKYSGSNSIGEVAWYYGNSGSKTHPVATKSPNELGIYDMSGNVWEWTSDIWCGDYNSSRSGSYRVDRGGGWSFDARYCRVSSRNDRDPSYTINYLGLRLAL
jgi:formylglycine-generating enzyme required for sulfatase activity